MLALKILAALQERTRTGKGQVILHDMVRARAFHTCFSLEELKDTMAGRR